MANRPDTILHFRKQMSPASLSAVTEVFADKKSPAILGGNLSDCKENRFSTFAAEPIEIFEFNSNEKDPLGKLRQALDKYKLTQTPPDLPKGMFPAGWIGYFSYELGRFIEPVARLSAPDDLNIPLIRLCFYDRAICYDHKSDSWYLIALQIDTDTETPEEKLASLAAVLSEAESITQSPLPAPADMRSAAIDISKVACNITEDYYFSAIEKIQRYIYDGDVYQINFSQRFECDYSARGIDLYHWQNRFNPSPYAAYIDAGDFTIVSASPEMFITARDGSISTSPIKGTRPREVAGATAEKTNQANFAELVKSEKDQAELNMIIDLERNDLTRVCQYGTVKVVGPRTIEAYPTVFHALATVQGKLYKTCDDKGRFGSTFCDILTAMFPGGSITGAPKIRAMEIIDELEPAQRSVYTGSIGFIGIDSSVCLNIAIRTVIIKEGIAFAQTGGGIVADSDAQAEWDETITKARALLAGIAAVTRAAEKKVEL